METKVEIYKDLPDNLEKIYQDISDKAFVNISKLTPGEKLELENTFFGKKYAYLFLKDAEVNEYRSVVCLTKREAKFGDQVLTAMGVGGLATLPKYQSKGYATELMSRVIEFIDEENADISYLNCGESLVHFYEKLGYASYPYYFLDRSGIERKDSEGMILNVNNDANIGELIKRSEELHIGEGNV